MKFMVSMELTLVLLLFTFGWCVRLSKYPVGRSWHVFHSHDFLMHIYANDNAVANKHKWLGFSPKKRAKENGMNTHQKYQNAKSLINDLAVCLHRYASTSISHIIYGTYIHSMFIHICVSVMCIFAQAPSFLFVTQFHFVCISINYASIFLLLLLCAPAMPSGAGCYHLPLWVFAFNIP